MKRLVFAACAGLSFAACAGEQLLNLPPAPKGGRFRTPDDLVWPAKPGEADVCLWPGDKFAACSITIDDNCKPDHAWWLKLTEELGIKVTWFVITDGPEKKRNPGFAGTWADFQKLADAGHSIQSHTTNHKTGKKDGPQLSDEEVTAMYRDSLAAINANITNNFACTIAYPCGEAHPEILARHAIGARGVYGVPNTANAINYLNTNMGGAGEGYVDAMLTGSGENPKWLRGKKELKRGWNVVLYHFVKAGRTPEEREKNTRTAERHVRNIAAHADRLWVARFDDAVKYGQERDSATLTVTAVGDEKIAFSLTDRMKDDIFDFPLTVKVRLPDGWMAVSATQGGKSVAARTVDHEGARFALVDAVPDRGEVVLTRK